MINEFRGPYRWLSNFWTSPFTLNAVGCVPEIYPGLTGRFTFSSVEQAYVAAKTDNPLVQLQVMRLKTPGEMKRFGKTISLRSNWEQIKLPVMSLLVAQKFIQNQDLAKKLVETGDHVLIEGNTWHDRFWGKCFCPNHVGEGKNELGKILMNVRKGLQ